MAKILVVDDVAIDRKLAGGLLEKSANFDIEYAKNGNEAIARINESCPDLVVTDLQMPGLDGLELVTTLVDSHPEVPVVLMTAHGSENVAAQALANGAACYVPKLELADELLATVSQILAANDTHASYRQLIACTRRTELEFELENDDLLIEPLVDLVQQMIASMRGFDPASRVRIAIAVEHALTNAMYRGNLEIPRNDANVMDRELIRERRQIAPFCDRRVLFSASLTPDVAKFTIVDSGPGFDLSTLPQPLDPESFREGHGRGLVLIQSFMDEVLFNDKGNELTLLKHANLK